MVLKQLFIKMKRSSILAHRGLFSCESEKNSSEALSRAFREGFGIETDLRDLNGKVVISHDPPRVNSFLPSFEWLLEQISCQPFIGRIAFNIKSDGLAELIETQIRHHAINMNDIFVFDMSIPDTVSYLCRNIPVYSRISEYEQIPAMADKVAGVWVDNFTGYFPQIQRAQDLIHHGIRVTIVSPELHHRDHASLWDGIMESGIYLSPLFELCTDFPREAASRFCQF